MKNPEYFRSIELRSAQNTAPERIVGAYNMWEYNSGEYSLHKVAEIMKVNYGMLVDYACERMQSDYPDIPFPEKRPVIEPMYDLSEWSKIEAGTFLDPDQAPTFELFYYLANPKK